MHQVTIMESTPSRCVTKLRAHWECSSTCLWSFLNFFVAEFFILFPTQRDCVSGNIFVGFSDTSAEHFFYGTLTPVSLQKLLEICNINHKLPGAMSTIGFPEGFQVLVWVGSSKGSPFRNTIDLSSFSYRKNVLFPIVCLWCQNRPAKRAHSSFLSANRFAWRRRETQC